MRTTIYLIINQVGTVAMRKNVPQLRRGEVAVKVKIEIPDTFFRQPIPEVNLSVPESLIIKPDVSVTIEEEGGEGGVIEE